jgi:hypothetical protein
MNFIEGAIAIQLRLPCLQDSHRHSVASALRDRRSQ